MDGGRLATLGLGDPIDRLPGVGPRRASDLKKVGVTTIGELLTLWPRRYLDRTRITPIAQVVPGSVATIRARIQRVEERRLSRQRRLLSLLVSDDTGSLTVSFFHARGIRERVSPGRWLLLSGRVELYRQRFTMTHPDFDVLEDAEAPRLGLWPVYPLAGSLKQRFVQDLTAMAVSRWASQLEDPLPSAIRRRFRLRELAPAVAHLHFPDNDQDREAARRRLVFDEFLRMALVIEWGSRRLGGQRAPVLNPDNGLVREVLDRLPFALTTGQHTAWSDIRADVAQPRPMARLLQGDVGSGKTVVALLAMMAAVGSGYQAALMVPTEILAEQHAQSLAPWLASIGVPLVLIAGHQRGPEVPNQPAVVVGTHALLSERVAFDRLGLVVVDEQHRFGVRQRAQLSDKGVSPHLLVMTATPIPRTLALTVYGDLALSRMLDKPAGRQPVKTIRLSQRDRRTAYLAVREAVRQGRQAYVVCPLVGETEEANGKAAEKLADGMRQIPGWRVGLIHGRLPKAEQARVMEAFRRGAIDVLVGTTILEVGLDVPNATVMVIEEADRFGLAQLHQLRGRIGRGAHPGTCYLIADPATDEAQARLDAMVKTADGFELAEQDLAIRGPGEFLGLRQHGLSGMPLVDWTRDGTLWRQAREAARVLLTADPELTREEHRALRNRLRDVLDSAAAEVRLH